MAEKVKKVNYTDNDRAIVAALKDSEPMTMAQLAEATGIALKSGHIVGAMNKGLIQVAGEAEVQRPVSRKVSTYVFVTNELQTRKDGKPYSYSGGETAILNVLANASAPLTLAQIAAELGVEKLSSGSINGLMKKGNVEKGEQVVVSTFAKSKVKTYAFLADIPE